MTFGFLDSLLKCSKKTTGIAIVPKANKNEEHIKRDNLSLLEVTMEFIRLLLRSKCGLSPSGALLMTVLISADWLLIKSVCDLILSAIREGANTSGKVNNIDFNIGFGFISLSCHNKRTVTEFTNKL